MKNLQEVAGYYFFGLGITYFLLALFVYNKLYLPQSEVVFNVLEIPFTFVALLYGASSLCLSLEENDLYSSTAATLVFSLAGVVLVGVISLNLFFPDVI
jgi:hypothetical protein